MNVLLRVALLAGGVCAAVATSFELKSAIAAADEESAVQAERDLLSAIEKGDASAAAKLLDDEFSWTDRTGKTRTKMEILPVLSSLAADRDTAVKTSDFGQVVLIRGSHRIPAQNASVRFARVWLERPEGWKVLVYQETTLAEKTPATRSGFGSPSGGAPVDCENPCKSVPYKPEGAAEQEVVAM